MKTKKDCMDLFLRLLDEATKKGIDLPTTKNADYRDKFNFFLDYACKYIAGIIKIPAVFTVTQYAENDSHYTGVFVYDMPTDFLSFDSVIYKRDSKSYEEYTNYKWEQNKKIVLNPYDVGTFDIHYFRYPAAILPTADDDTEIDAEDKAIELIVLEAGIKATAADNPSLSSYLRQLFIEQMNNVDNDPKSSQTTVQTIYTM